MPCLKRLTSIPKPGIVHLGPGAFFRAFSATYTSDAMDQKGGDWGIVAVSLRSPTTRDQLVTQDNLFTAVELGPNGRNARTIDSICSVLVAPENPKQVIDAMADPAIKVVSLTITEKGYGYDLASRKLDLNHPDIAHDLLHPSLPKSAIGFLVAALALRRQNGAGPLTVLSCDNLPSNGAVIRNVTLEFASAINLPDLADWIDQHITFPATMVDRITPATTPADLAALEQAEGINDPAAVFHEPFRQWVIEDNFAAQRPAWETAGAKFVKSVEAHEMMKLRCLNGTHSTLAYLGYLAGHKTIADCVSDAPFANLCNRLWAEEIVPTLPKPEGENLGSYTASLLTRYRNPAIRHQTWQIAMDGSLKLPQRILATISDNLEQNRIPVGLCLTVAAWMRYASGVDETGRKIDVRDPLSDGLRSLSDQATTPAEKVRALLSERRIFPDELAHHPSFIETVTQNYERLMTIGARQSVIEYCTGP